MFVLLQSFFHKNLSQYQNLAISSLKVGTDLQLPLVTYGKGKPAVLVISGVHGDEITSMRLLFEYIRWLAALEKQVKGAIHFLPILNPSAYLNGKRTGEDEKDLNRSYPGNPRGTITEQIAATVLEFASTHTLVVDLHSAPSTSALFPHPRVDEASVEFGKAFGTRFVFKRTVTPGLLAFELHQKNIPNVTIEIGGGENIYEDFYEEVFVGLDNLLAHGQFLEELVYLPPDQVIVESKRRVIQKATFTGIVTLRVQLKTMVTRGQIIGALYDPLQLKTIDLIAETSGVIFSLTTKKFVEKTVNCCQY